MGRIAKLVPKTLENSKSDRISIVDGYSMGTSTFSHNFYNNITYEKIFDFYRRHPALYSVTHKIASSALKNGWLFEEINPGKGKKTNLKMLNYWFDNINPFYTMESILYNAMINTLTGGHHLVEIDSGNWNLYSDIDMSTMYPNLLDKKGHYLPIDKAMWIQRDYESGLATRYIPMEWLIWFRLPAGNSSDSLIPISPIVPLALDLETDLWGREHNLGSIKNRSVINLLIDLGTEGDEEEAKKMLKYIEREYISTSTINKSNKPFITYGGMTVKEKGGQLDIDYVNLRDQTIEAIAMAYNVPMRLMGKEKSGIGQGKAKAEAILEFYECNIYPFQKVFESNINNQLIKRFYAANTSASIEPDYRFKFVRQDLTNIEEMVDLHTKLINQWVETPEEARFHLKDHQEFTYLGQPMVGKRFIKTSLSLSPDSSEVDLDPEDDEQQEKEKQEKISKEVKDKVLDYLVEYKHLHPEELIAGVANLLEEGEI